VSNTAPCHVDRESRATTVLVQSTVSLGCDGSSLGRRALETGDGSTRALGCDRIDLNRRKKTVQANRQARAACADGNLKRELVYVTKHMHNFAASLRLASANKRGHRRRNLKVSSARDVASPQRLTQKKSKRAAPPNLRMPLLRTYSSARDA